MEAQKSKYKLKKNLANCLIGGFECIWELSTCGTWHVLLSSAGVTGADLNHILAFRFIQAYELQNC